jgi:hypothetical protein
MPTLSIESNGRIEKTAVYYNGEQIGGIKELLISIDEEGAFDAVLQYESEDKKLYTKQIFSENLIGLKVVPPSFDEEEAMALRLLTIESSGEVENTMIFINDEPVDGIVSLFVNIKGATKEQAGGGLLGMFKPKRTLETNNSNFEAVITFRNEDDSIDVEQIF